MHSSFFCAFSAPKSARYVNVVLPFSPPPISKRCISTVKHYCIATYFVHFHHLSPTRRHQLLRSIAFQHTTFLSIDISHDLSVIITRPNHISTCPDTGAHYHALTLEFLLLSGPRLLGDPLSSYILEVWSFHDSAYRHTAAFCVTCLHTNLGIRCG